jgi:hypothetical protein
MPDLSHVMPNPVVVPILWGHDYVQYPDTTKLIIQMIDDLVTGPFMNGMAQYGVRRGTVNRPIIIDDANPPATIVYTDTNGNLVDEITHKLVSWIEAKQIPPPPANNLNQMYLIIPPSETTPEMYLNAGDPIGNGAQGWHNEGRSNPAAPPTYYWAIVKTNDCGSPSTGIQFVNNFAAKVCHEIAEQVVDRNNTFEEIGDPCVNNPVTYRGWSIQQYKSDWDQGCIRGDQPPPMPTAFGTEDGYRNIFVLGLNGNLWLEQAPFGNLPPARKQVDGTVFTFQPLSNDTVAVLGTDGKLWLEQAPFGKVPPARTQIDGSVQAFQALDSQTMLVLGIDGNLWYETGPFGKVPPSRVKVDGNVKQFRGTRGSSDVFVLGRDGNLWIWQGIGSNAAPTRQQVDSHVRSFQAGTLNTFVWVLGTDGKLWREEAPFGAVPPKRVLVDSTVLAFQQLDIEDVVVLRTDATLWLEQKPDATPTRTQIDANVMEFASTDVDNVLVLGGDGKLWWEQAPFGVVPPKRTLVDANVA